jgi:hypothetical protein
MTVTFQRASKKTDENGLALKRKETEKMRREVRSVPPNWQHPKHKDGTYQPLAVMPHWPPEERTHWQMYSAGTPISPVLGTEEELFKWMSKRDARTLAGLKAAWQLAFHR